MKFLLSRVFLKVALVSLLVGGSSLLTGCQRNNNSVKTVQPISRKRPYNPKKDKYRKRVKTVKKRYN